MATQRKQPAGAKALTGSDEAKRKAAVFLEAIAGLRTTQSASDELAIALVRYYVLETRMLQAMIDALEPKARGRKRSQDQELARLQDDNKRLEREVMRLQALYRITQRAVGVREDKPARKASKAKGAKKTRRVRRESRGERILKTLRNGTSPAAPTEAIMRGGGPDHVATGGA
jgi:hypothetical protein